MKISHKTSLKNGKTSCYISQLNEIKLNHEVVFINSIKISSSKAKNLLKNSVTKRNT
jgi:hypothetical protein